MFEISIPNFKGTFWTMTITFAPFRQMGVVLVTVRRVQKCED